VLFLLFIIASQAGCQKNVWHGLASSGKESVSSWEGGDAPVKVRAGLEVCSQLSSSAPASAAGRKAYATSATLLGIHFFLMLPT